jgi:hypothetical protein
MLNIDTIFQIKFYVKHHYSQTKLIPHPPDYSVSALNEGRHHTRNKSRNSGSKEEFNERYMILTVLRNFSRYDNFKSLTTIPNNNAKLLPFAMLPTQIPLSCDN